MRPALNGLVLIGGQSIRMGVDKSKLIYHGVDQLQYLQDLLRGYCETVFISCNAAQAAQLSSHSNLVKDQYENIGPMAAFLTAFDLMPDAAWLVVACDMPFVGHEVLQTLIAERDESKYATVFENPGTGKPEPLLAIWEPGSRKQLRKQHSNHAFSLQKAVISMDHKRLMTKDKVVFTNANKYEEYEKYYRQINSSDR